MIFDNLKFINNKLYMVKTDIILKRNYMFKRYTNNLILGTYIILINITEVQLENAKKKNYDLTSNILLNNFGFMPKIITSAS